jgi:hypothetical protein
MEVWITIVVIGLAGWFSWQGYGAWKRPRQMEALATKLGMYYMDEALPDSLRLEQTSLNNPHGACHVLDGTKCGARIVAFDCAIGSGRSSSLQTVIAVESKKDLYDALAMIPNFTLERAESWQVLLGYSTMMQIEELEAQIGNIESVLKS